MYGKTRRALDPRTGNVTIVPNPPSKVITATGSHTPLWDMPTQRRIEEEFQRRSINYTGIRTQRPSNLLHCGICGARVWVQYPGGYYNDKGRRWACSVDPKHVTRKDSELLPAFVRELTDQLEHLSDIQLPQPQDRTPQLLATLEELTARRARLLDGYEAGAITLTDYTARTSSLDNQIAQTQQHLTDQREHSARHAQRLQHIGGIAGIIRKTPNYLLKAPAQQVNAQLRTILQKIIITPASVTPVFIP